MGDPSFLIKIFANFIFYIMTLLFSLAPQTSYDSSNHMNTSAVLATSPTIKAAFHQQYWLHINRTAHEASTFKHNISTILPVDGFKALLAVSQDGTVWIGRPDNNTNNDMAWLTEANFSKVNMPSDNDRRGEIRHATYDEISGRLFFTIIFDQAGTGVYYTERKILKKLCRNSIGSINIRMLARIFGDHKFHGLCIDPAEQILFVTESHERSMKNTSGLWLMSLKDVDAHESSNETEALPNADRLKTNMPFRPFACAYYGGHLVVSDHANQVVSLFERKDTKWTLERFKVIAQMEEPRGVHFDPAGNLLVADRSNRRIELFQRLPGEENPYAPIWQSDLVQHHPNSVAAFTTKDNQEIKIAVATLPSGLFIFG